MGFLDVPQANDQENNILIDNLSSYGVGQNRRTVSRIQRKKKTLHLLRTKFGGNVRGCARALKMPESTLRWWTKNEEHILTVIDGNGYNLPGQGRKSSFIYGDELLQFIQDQRRIETPISIQHLVDFVRVNHPDWYETYSENRQIESLSRMLRRFCVSNNILQKKPSSSKELNSDLLFIQEEYRRQFVQKYAGKYDINCIFNCDETGIQYDYLPKTILCPSGVSPKVRGYNKGNGRMSVMLTVSASGAKLPLFFILPGKPGGTIEKDEIPSLPEEAYYAVQINGYMDAEVWPKFLRRCMKPAIQDPSVLVLDNLACHVSEKSYSMLCSYGTILEPLPVNSTSHCQPLDVGVMGPFKKKLAALSLREGKAKGTAKQKRRIIINRVIKVYGELSEDLIRASWRKSILTDEWEAVV